MFKKYIEELLDIILLEEVVFSLLLKQPIKSELENINQDFTFILNKANKKIEGQRRCILYSKEKAKRKAVI